MRLQHLLVFLRGDFLEEIRDSFAFWDIKVHALEERDHLLTWPMEDQIACTMPNAVAQLQNSTVGHLSRNCHMLLLNYMTALMHI